MKQINLCSQCGNPLDDGFCLNCAIKQEATIRPQEKTMEKQNTQGKINAISVNKGSVLIDIGDGEKWLYVADNVKPFIGKLKKGEAELQIIGDKIVFIRNIGLVTGPVESKYIKKEYSSDAIKQMSELKNHTNARVSALTCAKDICIARSETSNEQVVNTALEFLKFIEDGKVL